MRTPAGRSPGPCRSIRKKSTCQPFFPRPRRRGGARCGKAAPRRSLAWALQVDPKEIDLPAFLPEAEKARWRELFKYPRSVMAGCLAGLTQTGGGGLFLWGATLFTLVLGVSPAQAAFLYIWVS